MNKITSILFLYITFLPAFSYAAFPNNIMTGMAGALYTTQSEHATNTDEYDELKKTVTECVNETKQKNKSAPENYITNRANELKKNALTRNINYSTHVNFSTNDRRPKNFTCNITAKVGDFLKDKPQVQKIAATTFNDIPTETAKQKCYETIARMVASDDWYVKECLTNKIKKDYRIQDVDDYYKKMYSPFTSAKQSNNTEVASAKNPTIESEHIQKNKKNDATTLISVSVVDHYDSNKKIKDIEICYENIESCKTTNKNGIATFTHNHIATEEISPKISVKPSSGYHCAEPIPINTSDSMNLDITNLPMGFEGYQSKQKNIIPADNTSFNFIVKCQQLCTDKDLKKVPNATKCYVKPDNQYEVSSCKNGYTPTKNKSACIEDNDDYIEKNIDTSISSCDISGGTWNPQRNQCICDKDKKLKQSKDKKTCECKNSNETYNKKIDKCEKITTKKSDEQTNLEEQGKQASEEQIEVQKNKKNDATTLITVSVVDHYDSSKKIKGIEICYENIESCETTTKTGTITFRHNHIATEEISPTISVKPSSDYHCADPTNIPNSMDLELKNLPIGSESYQPKRRNIIPADNTSFNFIVKCKQLCTDNDLKKVPNATACYVRGKKDYEIFRCAADYTNIDNKCEPNPKQPVREERIDTIVKENLPKTSEQKKLEEQIEEKQNTCSTSTSDPKPNWNGTECICPNTKHVFNYNNGLCEELKTSDELCTDAECTKTKINKDEYNLLITETKTIISDAIEEIETLCKNTETAPAVCAKKDESIKKIKEIETEYLGKITQLTKE